MKEDTGRTVIYGRVSTKEQSVESQLVVVRGYAKVNLMKIDQEYIDVGVSGAKDSRPQQDLMLKSMREGSINTILLYKLDRLGRSLNHLINLLSEFRNKKVRLISVSDNLDTNNDNPMSRAFWQLLGVFAEFERELIRERVRAGLERVKKEGVKLGRPKGSKDKRKRSVSGYISKYAGTTKEQRKLGPRKEKQNEA